MTRVVVVYQCDRETGDGGNAFLADRNLSNQEAVSHISLPTGTRCLLTPGEV